MLTRDVEVNDDADAWPNGELVRPMDLDIRAMTLHCS